MKRFSVVFVSGSLHLSGSTIWINNLVRAMEDLKIPCAHVIVGREKKIKSQATYSYCTGQARKTFLVRALRIMRAHVWWPSFYRSVEDRYYCNTVTRFLSGKLDETVLVIKDFSAPLPSCFSGGSFRVLSVLHHQHSEFIAGPQNILVAVSNAIMEESEKLGFKVDKVIYNPVYKDKILQLADAFVPVERKYIVFVGRLIPDKGVHELLKAFVLLRERGAITHKLVFVGSGNCEKELRLHALRVGLHDQVIFTGFQENPYPYIKNAQLLVLPSYSEAMGYVAVEASILGVAYLVSNFAAGKEFFPQENTFDMAESESDFIANLGDKMLALLEKPDAKLRDGVLNKMNPKNIASQYLQLFKEF